MGNFWVSWVGGAAGGVAMHIVGAYACMRAVWEPWQRPATQASLEVVLLRDPLLIGYIYKYL